MAERSIDKLVEAMIVISMLRQIERGGGEETVKLVIPDEVIEKVENIVSTKLNEIMNNINELANSIKNIESIIGNAEIVKIVERIPRMVDIGSIDTSIELGVNIIQTVTDTAYVEINNVKQVVEMSVSNANITLSFTQQ